MLIVDACVAASWYLTDESYDPEIQSLAFSRQIVVPRIWPLEIQNIFLISERRGRITASEADAACSDLFETLDISIDEPSEAFGAEMSLARGYGLTSYDASYLELAMRKRLHIVTDDKKLAAAARNLGLLHTTS